MRLTLPQLAKRTRRLAALAILALVPFALSGCQVVSGTQVYTQVRFIDASPNAPGLDVYQNGTVSLYNIGFGSASSYIAVPPGSYTYSVDTAGTRQLIDSVNGTLALDSQYTILISNVLANLQMTVLRDESVPAPSGQVALRILDQSLQAGPVDIYLVAANGTLAATSPLLTSVSFGNAPAYIDVPSNSYSLVILAAGTSTKTTTTTTTTTTGSGSTTTTTTSTTTNTIPTIYSGNQIEYPGASVRTIVLIDQPLSNPAGIQVIAADDYDSPGASN
jgi:hypothetical protein